MEFGRMSPQINFGLGPIIEDTAMYSLYGSENLGDPGYLYLEPKGAGFRTMWPQRCLSYLQNYSHPFAENTEPNKEMFTYQSGAKYAFNYKDGSVKVNLLVPSRVSIQENHPNKMQVIMDLLSLYYTNPSNYVIHYA